MTNAHVICMCCGNRGEDYAKMYVNAIAGDKRGKSGDRVKMGLRMIMFTLTKKLPHLRASKGSN